MLFYRCLETFVKPKFLAERAKSVSFKITHEKVGVKTQIFNTLVNFGYNDMKCFELSAHLIFLSQSILNKEINEDEYQKQTLRYSSFMLQQLHLHHEMEDNYFFPVLQNMIKS